MFRARHTAAAKLTGEQVINLREEYVNGATQGSLARKYHLSVNQVGRIVRGECWNALPNVARLAAMPEADEIARSAQRLSQMMSEVETPVLPAELVKSDYTQEDLEREQRMAKRFEEEMNNPKNLEETEK